MDYQAIIDKYYPEENELRRILMIHSRSVADKALAIAEAHPAFSEPMLQAFSALERNLISVMARLVRS